MKLIKKTLAIYDFDNTICMTNLKVNCYNIPKETMFQMTPDEYSKWRATGEYDKNPNRWNLDFSNFQGYPKDGTENRWVTSFLKKDIKNSKVIAALVTGRDELSGPKQWLKDNNINTKAMVLMCSGDPNKKMCYESLICTFEPDEVIIYEDGQSYIDQCREVCQKYNLNLSATHVLPNGAFNIKNYKLQE